ncbi:MAG: hypothetical protein AAFZ09_02895 [Pseudomonadota bacterium]
MRGPAGLGATSCPAPAGIHGATFEPGQDTGAPPRPGRLAQLRLWRARLRHRRALRDELFFQPDSVLADAGLTRAAAEAEARRPFWRA